MPDAYTFLSDGRTNLLILKRTNPQIVKIICLYRGRARRNLSLATRNILTRPITCSTPMRDEDNSLFSFFWDSVISPNFGFL